MFKNLSRLSILSVLASLAYYHSTAQVAGLKSNLLYGLSTLTPNLGVEIGLSGRTTLEFTGSYNPWNLNGTDDNNRKAVHWRAQSEARYWFCERFNGHFIGAHAFAAQYNISGQRLPMIFGNGSENNRFQGWALGAGVSYGYQFVLSRKWNLELNAGIGYAYMEYDRYDCKRCGDFYNKEQRNYWGPTKVGISLIYVFN